MKLSIGMIGVVALLWSGCGAGLHNGTPRQRQVRINSGEIWIVSKGEARPIYQLDDRFYLLGEKGAPYAICLHNRLERRLEAVVAVDGRDVISGRVADYQTDRGYVLLPDEEICIEGFRRSLDQVAAFEFSEVAQSYAALRGDARNVGVIGVALFEEVDAPPTTVSIAAPGGDVAREAPAKAPTAYESEDAAGAVAQPLEQQRSGLGTRYGDHVDSAAEIVPFVRRDAQRPQEVVALYYDDRQGLEQRGIVIDDRSADPSPDPFPGVEANAGQEFAPPPQ